MEKLIDETTIHGIKDFATAKTFGYKVLWLSVIVVAVGITVYGLYETMDEYLQYPTAVNIDFKEFDVQDFGLPPVALCPMYFLDGAELKKQNITASGIFYILSMMRNIGNRTKGVPKNQPQLNIDYATGKAELYRTLGTNGSVHDWLRHNHSVSPPICSNCLEGYPIPTLTPNGLCFVMRTNGYLEEQPERMQLRFSYKESSTSLVMPTYAKFEYSAPIIKIDADIYNDVAENEIEAPLEKTTTVKVSIAYTKQISKSWSNSSCKDVNSPRINDTKNYCKWRCFDAAGASQLNCSWLSTDPTVALSNTCDAYSFNSSTEANYAYSTCASYCSKVCTRVDYVVIPVYTGFTAAGSANRSNVVISFQNAYGVVYMSETLIYSWETLVGNVGGVLGLYLGASIMSLLQLIYLVILTIKCKMKKTKQAAAHAADTAVMAKQPHAGEQPRTSMLADYMTGQPIPMH